MEIISHNREQKLEEMETMCKKDKSHGWQIHRCQINGPNIQIFRNRKWINREVTIKKVTEGNYSLMKKNKDFSDWEGTLNPRQITERSSRTKNISFCIEKILLKKERESKNIEQLH